MDGHLPMTPDDIVREAEMLCATLDREYAEEGQDPQIWELSRDLVSLVREVRASQSAGVGQRVERRGRSFEGTLRDLRRRYESYKDLKMRQQLALQRRRLLDMQAKVDSLEREMQKKEKENEDRLLRHSQPFWRDNAPMWLLLLVSFGVLFSVGLLVLLLFLSGISVARAH